MKIKTLASMAISLATVLTSQAAVILDSGLNGTTVSTFGILNGNNTGKAIGFSLGTSAQLGPAASSGYALESITVHLNNPRASTIQASDYTFSLWSSDGDPSPSTQLATFTSVNLTASATADYTLAVSAPFTLLPSSTYWIVAQSTLTDLGNGSTLPIWWGLGGTATTAPGISPTSPVGRFGSTGAPSSWTGSSGLLNDIQINATAVPEPTSGIMLLGSIGILLGLRRRSIR